MKRLLLHGLLHAYPEIDYAANAGKPWLWFRRVHIGRSDGDTYLQRFILLRCPLGAVYLHRFFRGDEDKCLHDHPWNFLSLILKGGYWEETPDTEGAEGATRRRWIKPGALRYCPAAHRHRVILDENRTGNVWTLILTSTKVRSWGFWTDKGRAFVGWREFIAGGMKGCE